MLELVLNNKSIILNNISFKGKIMTHNEAQLNSVVKPTPLQSRNQINQRYTTPLFFINKLPTRTHNAMNGNQGDIDGEFES